MNLSPYFFLPKREYMELELRSVEVQGAHEIGGRALGGKTTFSRVHSGMFCYTMLYDYKRTLKLQNAE